MSHTVERVTHAPSPSGRTGHYIPRAAAIATISASSSTGVEERSRPFRPDDAGRVMDYDDMPDPPPADGALLLCEDAGGSTGVAFPRRHAMLRGGFVFYFDEKDVAVGTSGPDGGALYRAPPLGVVPIGRCEVDFPPGGRRVFREHAHTDAKNGYELRIHHKGPMAAAAADASSEVRPDAFLVLSSLGQREAWASAIRVRAEAYRRDTKLRPGPRGGRGDDDCDNVGVDADAGTDKTDAKTAAASDENETNPFADSQTLASGGDDDGDEGDDDGDGEGAGTGAGTGPGPGPGAGAGASAGPGEGKSGPPGSTSGVGGKRHGPRTRTRNAPLVGGGRARGGGGGDANLRAPLTNIDVVGVHVDQLGVSGDDAKDVESALRNFGKPFFDENVWIDEYFRDNKESDAAEICDDFDRWQGAMKKALRGAVLEQYEYFVEASREMTIMGREVQSLRQLAEGQRETIAAMKNIDFAAAFADPVADDYGYSSEEESEEADDEDDDDDDDDEGKEVDSMGSSVASSQTDSTGWSGKKGKDGGGARRSKPPKKAAAAAAAAGGGGGAVTGGKDDGDAAKTKVGTGAGDDGNEIEGTLIEIPTWLADATEEVSAFIKECRYTDATDLILKVKNQVNEILNQHEKLTEMRLSKKQLANMQRILHDVEGLTDRVGNRLAEGLRRKNEALKQAAKRERADPLSVLAPLVSPICLGDDATALSLLVKLGKPQDAATAYAARRSLLLMECLHERPISSSAGGNAGAMDVVIYAAQLSQSFFSCLAMAVEGFLDLFLDNSGGSGNGGGGGERDDGEASSIHSAVGRRVPAGAIAAVVLWCDSELSKFAAAFGGTRVLGNLALSPPVRVGGVIVGGGAVAVASSSAAARDLQIEEARSKLREAEEGGQYAAAARIRQRLAELEREGKEEEQQRRIGRRGGGDDRLPKATAVEGKDRQAAIDVASKCVDQAFQFASENLDSIGLPLTPRLAEYIRARLKGCEAEIASCLEGRWDHITFDWANDEGGTEVDQPRRGRMELRSEPGDDG